nr:MAG TPA: hypothetical protein [Caudoviricetes sp.]
MQSKDVFITLLLVFCFQLSNRPTPAIILGILI